MRPAGAPVSRCRFWDLASTKQRPGTDPDWTVGALVSRWSDGFYSVDDVVRLRDTPGIVDKTILAVTQQDGRVVRVRIEQQIGTGGVFQAAAYTEAAWSSYDFAPRKPTGEKSTSLEAALGTGRGRERLAGRGLLERSLCARVVRPCRSRHDDQADAVAGAFNEIAEGYSVQAYLDAWGGGVA